MSDLIIFQDATGPNTGTPITADVFDALMISVSCVLSMAGSLPASGPLTLNFPAMDVIVNDGISVAKHVSVSAHSVTVSGGGSKDNYIYIDATGTYSQLAVTSGASAPSNPTKLCLCYATTNSGNTATTAVVPVAPPYRQAQNATTLPANATIGGKSPILSDGTNSGAWTHALNLGGNALSAGSAALSIGITTPGITVSGPTTTGALSVGGGPTVNAILTGRQTLPTGTAAGGGTIYTQVNVANSAISASSVGFASIYFTDTTHSPVGLAAFGTISQVAPTTMTFSVINQLGSGSIPILAGAYLNYVIFC